MIIEVEELKDLSPIFARGVVCLQLSVKMDDRQAEDLFYKLWEQIGDEKLGALIEAEGFQLLPPEGTYTKV